MTAGPADTRRRTMTAALSARSATLTIRSAATPLEARVAGLQFPAVRDGLWRVTTPDAQLLGHIERDADGRFSARRFLGGNRLRSLGEFWSAQSAADCFVEGLA